VPGGVGVGDDHGGKHVQALVDAQEFIDVGGFGNRHQRSP
jgi:hypothetical protein